MEKINYSQKIKFPENQFLKSPQKEAFMNLQGVGSWNSGSPKQKKGLGAH